jgi:ubiquinone/menaquinone biosynthesis C-methylase UbiE
VKGVPDDVALQRRYYGETAAHYDSMHVSEGDEHGVALRYVASLAAGFGARSVLDVGCGTGRGVRYLADQGFATHGIEPVPELLKQARTTHDIPDEWLTQGEGQHLPFADGSFDVACEFAVLHHVPQPEVVVREMMRVARRAVFLSDSNRYGQGPWPARWAKLALSQAHLWNTAIRIKRGGRPYTVTAGDGVSYSYSVYDSFGQLSAWADRIFIIPLEMPTPVRRGWVHPLLTCRSALLCALREDPEVNEGGAG